MLYYSALYCTVPYRTYGYYSPRRLSHTVNPYVIATCTCYHLMLTNQAQGHHTFYLIVFHLVHHLFTLSFFSFICSYVHCFFSPFYSFPRIHSSSQAKASSSLFASTIDSIKEMFDFRATNTLRHSKHSPRTVSLSATASPSFREKERERDREKNSANRRKRHKDPSES